MKNKKVIIIGGSKGIGKATVSAFAGKGAHVLFTYRSGMEAAKSVEASVNQGNAQVKAVHFDLTDISQIREFFTSAVNQFNGPPDIVIINAFPSPVFMPTEHMTIEGYDQMFDATKGTYFTLVGAAKSIKDGGSIIVISSGAAMNPQPANGLYAGAKAAIERFTLSLARELGDRQVNVNCLSPGFTKTEDFNAPEEMINMIVNQTPLGRLGAPVDVANTVLALALPENKWITGQIIQANGGIF